MKRIVCLVILGVLCLTAAIGVIDYTNFRHCGCRIDFSDPWQLGDDTLYYGKLLTDEGIVDCWKTEQEWDRIMYRNLRGRK